MTRACDAALPSLREGEQEDPGFARLRAPFTREFPGLAPSGGAPLTPAERQHALDVMLPEMRLTPLPQPTARIGLVAGDRPRRRAARDRLMLDMAVAKDEGLDNGITCTPEFRTPTTFRQWCIDVLKPAIDA